MLKCVCGGCNSVGVVDILTLCVSFLALVVAVIIPERIMWAQTYAGLFTEYRSHDFSLAVEGIVNFFYDECGCDFLKIPEKYKERFKKEKVESGNGSFLDPRYRLHSQRRLIAQYFWQLEQFAENPLMIFQRRRILQDFTRSEANILKIVYFMNLAIDDDGEMYKDISSKVRIPRKGKDTKNINIALARMIKILEKCRR